ncbi:phage tail protein [Citrobacter sp. Cpo015]|uniref:phage tail protein n=1 Tax=Citrobacter sp. Cpo015 TaxID=2985121 RepID=UPI002575D525|nr:phage tail protein [Citrobacter sp. Cpo015]MDM2905898.1 phage tail protein [Citrobacter sp. Cpo015]
MTAKYFAILTNQGAARLANAAALGTKLNLTQMAVGDANGVLPTPDPAQTKLINQKRIAPLNLLTVDPANTSQIIAEQIIPENEGGFWIREIGLYDDAGVLIAVANCPETYKPELQEGSGRTQTIRMILIVSSTSAITLKIDPSVVLATRQYVDDKVIEVKSYADGLIRAHEQSRNHPDATTTAKGFTQLNSSVTDDRETQSATPKAVKIAMDNANARLAKERNLSDLTNPALARQNLQLGDSSTKNTGTTANTVAAGDDARITGAMQKSQNGADIQDVAKFLQNLGLDTALAAKQPLSTQLTYFANHSDTEILQYLGVPSVISAAISSLVDSSPAALDTLNELAEALGNDPNFSTTVLNKLAGKQPLDATLTGLSGKNDAGLRAYLSLKSAATRDVGSLNGQLPGMDLFASTIAGTGEKALPDSSTGTGMFILKWGAIAAPTAIQDITTLFQTPFPNKCLRVFAIADYEPGTGNVMYVSVNNSTLQRDRFVARFSGSANYTSGVYFALGY